MVVHDSIIDDAREKNAFGLLMSLNMLIETPGGFDYTGADCIGWMKEAGFRECRVEHLVGPDSMVIKDRSKRGSHHSGGGEGGAVRAPAFFVLLGCFRAGLARCRALISSISAFSASSCGSESK